MTVRHRDATSEETATVTAIACTGPVAPVTFTFTKTASTATAAVGDTIGYTYCGHNTSDIPLEVVRLVDDRLGVVIELPDVTTVVPPGGSLCNTDLGIAVSYTVGLADVGTTVTNHAVVTVRTQEAAPRVFQATATAVVDVAIPAHLLATLIEADKTWVCHYVGSADHDYNLIEVSTSSANAGGHANHPMDIIPPGPWGPGQNWDPEDGAVWLNNWRRRPASNPAAPLRTSSRCSARRAPRRGRSRRP